MNERTMFELLEVYDAVKELREIEMMLTGTSIACGPDEGIMGKLAYVPEIIARNSPLHIPGVDLEKTYYWKVLDDEGMDNRRKARVLLGIAD